jgi:hypothetical protein
MFGLESDRPIRFGIGNCSNCGREQTIAKLTANHNLCSVCRYLLSGEYESDKVKIAQAIHEILGVLQERKARMSEDNVLARAYELYDADPRVNGPDDAAAFRDSIRQAFRDHEPILAGETL